MPSTHRVIRKGSKETKRKRRPFSKAISRMYLTQLAVTMRSTCTTHRRNAHISRLANNTRSSTGTNVTLVVLQGTQECVQFVSVLVTKVIMLSIARKVPFTATVPRMEVLVTSQIKSIDRMKANREATTLAAFLVCHRRSMQVRHRQEVDPLILRGSEMKVILLEIARLDLRISWVVWASVTEMKAQISRLAAYSIDPQANLDHLPV